MTNPERSPQAYAIEYADTAVRNAGFLLVQRALHVIAAAAFAVLVPRLMGPTDFGRYALLMSVSMWFTMLSGLGAVPLITRSVPQLLAAGDLAGVRKLVTSLLVLRSGTAVFSAAGYVLLTLFALGERDLTATALVAGAVFARIIANICFAFALGLHQAARWGLGDLARRWLTLVCVLVGIRYGGLRGTCAGVFAAELTVLGLGVLQASTHFRWASLDLSRAYLAPFLRTAALFAIGNFLFALVQRSGETLVRLSTGDYSQVGYYGAAISIYLTGAGALWQFALAFAPLLITHWHTGDAATVKQWVERLLKWMSLGAVPIGFAVLFTGADLVPFVLGAHYRPVVRELAPLTIAMFTVCLTTAGRLLALTCDRPRVNTIAGAIELLTFWLVGWPLAKAGGSLGACVTVAIASALGATFITWRMRRVLAYSPRGAATVVGLALVFVPLAALRSGPLVNLVLFGAAASGWTALLFWRRIVTVDDLRVLRLSLLRPRVAPVPVSP